MNSRFLKNFTRKETVVRAIKVALVITPILTLINQYDVIIKGDFNSTFFLKLFLTFLVPYGVSAYSSAKAYGNNIDK